MMTKYEAAKRILAESNLPPSQVDNLETLELQVLDLGLKLYPTRARDCDLNDPEKAKCSVRMYAETIQGVAKFLLVVGADIHNFRMTTLRRYLEVPPEMQLDDVIARLATRDCDVVHDDAPGSEHFGKNQNTEKGKEEGKEEKSPHTPLKEKGKAEREKEEIVIPSARACAREDEQKPLEDFEAFFDEFWGEYPSGRKVGKKKCRAKLLSRYKNAEDPTKFTVEVMAGLDAWLKCEQWLDGYPPNAETFINREQWKDDPPDKCPERGKQRGVSQTANVKSTRAKGLW